MKIEGYYSTGQLMKLAHITKKTVRYYDEHHILKPSFVSESGARFYTDSDLGKLQQILLLKNLGFSLEDIRQMTIPEADPIYLSDSLKMQLRLVEDRIEQLQIVAETIRSTSDTLEKNGAVDWSRMLELIRMSGMEQSQKNQYQNASNISARIQLHHLYSANHQGWFPWIFEQCGMQSGMDILELGCGDGAFWKENLSRLPSPLQVTLSDLSEGMLRDVRRNLDNSRDIFHYRSFDCEHIPFADDTFDLILANHVLFYCNDLPAACREIRRVLKPGGVLICGTYGSSHMKEVSQLVSDFDDRIRLSAEKLYERFGRENGQAILEPCFTEVRWIPYEDHLLVPEPEPLISYVLSCHGNQNQYILDRYSEFRSFVKKRIGSGFYITKDAGIFHCRKKN